MTFAQQLKKQRNKKGQFVVGYTPQSKGKTGVYSKKTLERMSVVKMGENNPMFGRKASEETKRKISESHKGEKNYWYGKHLSKEHGKKIGKATKERLKNKEDHPFFGRKHTEESNVKNSEAHRGKKSSFWVDGRSYEPYGVDFDEELKKQIRKRDSYRCQECFRHQDELYTKSDRKYKLHIHHIDYDKKNNEESNLVSLCRNCHVQTNFNRGDWTNYYSQRGKA